MNVFNEHMPLPHQILRKQINPRVSEDSLLAPHTGEISEAGIRTNISVGVEYIAAWLTGRGAVPIHNLMEDAATAEISRSQIWQWLRHGATVRLADESTAKMTSDLFERIFDEEMDLLRARMTDAEFSKGRFVQASEIFKKTATSVDFVDFLTLPAYRALLTLN